MSFINEQVKIVGNVMLQLIYVYIIKKFEYSLEIYVTRMKIMYYRIFYTYKLIIFAIQSNE